MQKLILYLLFFFLLPLHTLTAMQNFADDYKKNLKAQSPRAFRNLKKRKLCLIHPENENVHPSEPFRILAFEALKNCGHPRPEIVMLTNDSSDSPACAGKKDTYVYINIDESKYAQESYGNQRITLHHEAAHLVRQEYSVNRDRPLWHRHEQNDERTADRIAVTQGNCYICAREYAADFINNNRQENHTHPILKLNKTVSIIDMDNMSAKEKKQLLRKTYKISKKRKMTHPIHLERALRAHSYSLALGGALCQHHKNFDNESEQHSQEIHMAVQ